MTPRCDRCGGRATHRYEQARLSFVLCDTHHHKHGPRLRTDGWTVLLVDGEQAILDGPELAPA